MSASAHALMFGQNKASISVEVLRLDLNAGTPCTARSKSSIRALIIHVYVIPTKPNVSHHLSPPLLNQRPPRIINPWQKITSARECSVQLPRRTRRRRTGSYISKRPHLQLLWAKVTQTRLCPRPLILHPRTTLPGSRRPPPLQHSHQR